MSVGGRPDEGIGPYDKVRLRLRGTARRGRRALRKGSFMSVGADVLIRPPYVSVHVRRGAPLCAPGTWCPVRTLRRGRAGG
jgi:hypothetical protein